MSKWYTNPEGILVQKEDPKPIRLKPKAKSNPIKIQPGFVFQDIPRPFGQMYGDLYYINYEANQESNSILIWDDAKWLNCQELVNLFNALWFNEYGENFSTSDLTKVNEQELQIQIPTKIEDKKKALQFLIDGIHYLDNEAVVEVKFTIEDKENKIYISNGDESPLFVEYLITDELKEKKKYKSIHYDIYYKDDKMIIDYTKDKNENSKNGEYNYFAFKNAIKEVQKKHNTGNNIPQTEYDNPLSDDNDDDDNYNDDDDYDDDDKVDFTEPVDSESDDKDPLGDMMDDYLTTCHARR